MIVQDKDGEILYSQGSPPKEAFNTNPEDWTPLGDHAWYYNPKNEGEIIMNRPYQRLPIFINNHTVAVLNLYQRHDCLEDMWKADCFHHDGIVEANRDARQFVDQMEEYWTPAFLMALRDEITARLREHDRDFGTEFADRFRGSLEEEKQPCQNADKAVK